ncbi:MAG TPA: serine/threonine-protein kinase [Kofleriaceae bacterium]|nr:serine/threonine-protein kinase [Kofleriaceae bacterium]
MAARAGSAIAIVAGAGAAIGLWLASAGKPGSGPTHEQSAAAATEIASSLRAQAQAMHGRAATLAQLPSLAKVVATDAGTVKDQTAEERMFQPQPGETIDIGQVTGGTATGLLRLPADSPVEAPLTVPGTHFLVRGQTLMLVDVETIQPTQIPADKPQDIKGVLALSHTVDTDELAAKVGAIGGGAITIGKDSIVLGKAAPSGPTESIAIPDAPDGAVLVAPTGAPAVPPSTPLRAGAIAAAVLGLIAAALLGRSKKGAQPQIPPMLATATTAGAGTVTTQPPPMPQRSGSPFGRYQPIKLLGSGGMADVYLARSVGEAGFEKQVALKIMHPHLGRVEDAVAHFLDEARLASRLTHPNIVQIFDLGKNGEDYFIAMEYIEGSDLERVLINMRAGQRKIPVAIGLGILRKVCDGLHAAHTAVDNTGAPLNLVHRDVKSANVLVSKDGAVKVADFGIVKAEQQVHKTSVGQAKGTAAFMAPEQRMGSKVDVRADVYGVGAMGYEVLTGLEVNLDLVGMLQKGVEGWPHLVPPSQVRPQEVPPELDHVIWRALAFEPDGRYPTMSAMEDELAHIARARSLVATDKEIAQWIGAEIALLPRTSVQGPAAVAPTSAV